MDAAPEGSGPTATTVDADPSLSSSGAKEPQKPATALEEDDEFEDFPIDDWPQEETEVTGEGGNTHLWEESWDDDDTSEDFSKQLKQELEKVRGNNQ